MNDVFGLFHHLALCDPERRLGNGGGEVVDLDAVELVDGDLNRVQHPHDDLVFEEQGEDFVFQAAEGKVAFREEVAGTAGGVNVPADFDTIEKTFSGIKTAEKGIKQGISRSNADFEIPCLLYSAVDFYHSKARWHRGV